MYEQLSIFAALKTCTRCHCFLPATIDFFYRNKRSSDGLLASCKKCDNARRNQVGYKPQTLEQKERKREYYQKNKVKIAQYSKEHYEKNRERSLEQMRLYREKHRDWDIERKREYYRQNPKQHLKWRNANRERWRLTVRRYQARKKGAEGAYTFEDVRQIYINQNGRCAYCTQQLHGKYDIDHIVPLSRGGTNYPSNLCCACRRCNSGKGNKTRKEFMWILGKDD